MKKLIALFIVSCFILTLCVGCTLVNPGASKPGDATSEYLLTVIAENGGTVPAARFSSQFLFTMPDFDVTPVASFEKASEGLP